MCLHSIQDTAVERRIVAKNNRRRKVYYYKIVVENIKRMKRDHLI